MSKLELSSIICDMLEPLTSPPLAESVKFILVDGNCVYNSALGDATDCTDIIDWYLLLGSQAILSAIPT